jgi:hypothetical protein
VKAGVFVAPLVVTRTPFVPAVVLLQFGEAPAHGTELVFFVVLKKTQVAGGVRVCAEELQELAAAVRAIWYSTKLAFPWRRLLPAVASDCPINAMMPAKAGDDTEVPPAP